MSTKVNAILSEVAKERSRQDEKFGEQNHLGIEWIAILSEEVGEAAKEILDYHFKYPPKNFEGTFEDCQKQRLKDYRTELIQVAAVAVQMVECLDRNGK